MRRRTYALWALCVSLGLASGCAVNLDIPDTAALLCTSDPECPAQNRCSAVLGKCVALLIDGNPPALVAAAVTPANAKAGDTVTLSFEVDRTLGLQPVVTLSDPQNTAFRLESEDDKRYVFSLTASAAPEGTWNVVGSFVAEDGQRADAVTLASLTLDFTPPQLAGAVVASPSVVGGGGTLVLQVSASEALQAAPAATLSFGGDARELTESSASSARDYVFTYAVKGDEPQGLADLTLSLIDVAGNRREVSVGAAARFDLQGPQLLAQSTSLRLVPAADNPLREVQSVGLGTTVQLFVAFDEPVADEIAGVSYPSVTAGSDALPFTRTLKAGSTYIFELPLSATLMPSTDGAQAITIVAADLLGNTSVIALDPASLAFVVDTAAPAEPQLASDGAAVFTRKPWGSDSRETPSFFLRAASGTIESNATVIVTTEDGSEITRLRAASDGSLAWPDGLPLAISDRTGLLLSVVDDAGNRSDHSVALAGAQATPIVDVDWHATLGSKIAGSTLENPHRAVSQRRFGPERDLPGNELGADAGISLADAVTTTTAGASTWKRLTDANKPSPRRAHAVTFDVARDALLLQGGTWTQFFTTVEHRDSWARKGAQWSAMSISDPEGDGSPASVSPLFVYDPQNAVSVLAPSDGGVTWIFNGTSYRKVATTGQLPSGGVYRAVAYDAARRAVVMMIAGSGLWRFDGRAWTALCTGDCASTGPTPAAAFSMSYHASTRELLLLSGGQLWAFRPDGTWQGRCVSSPCTDDQPHNRNRYAMTYDAQRDRTLIYGGCSSGSDPCPLSYVDLWSYDAQNDRWTCEVPEAACGSNCFEDVALCNLQLHTDANWLEAIPAGVPLHGAASALTYVPGRGRSVLVGGQGHSMMSWATDTWEWDGTSWRRFDHAMPAAMLDASFATGGSDSARYALYFGGRNNSDIAQNSTWLWDGERWQSACSGACVPPSARSQAALAYDPQGARFILFGGRDASNVALGDVWSFDPVNQWQQLCASGCGPAADVAPQMTYDASLSQLVLVVALPEVAAWKWNGASFDPACVSPDCVAVAPMLSAAGALVFDPISSRLLMHGGPDTQMQGATYVTHARSGSEGFSVVGSFGSVARSVTSAVLDPARSVATLFGGGIYNPTCPHCAAACSPDSAECDAVFTWDGAQWMQPPLDVVADIGTPLPRASHAAAVDPNGQGMIVFGGFYTRLSGGPPVKHRDGWLWDSGADDVPAHVFHLTFSASGADPTTVSGLRVEWRGAAEGFAGSGAKVLVWDVGGWRSTTLTSSDATGLVWDSRQDAGWSTMTANDYARLFVGSRREVSIAIVPASPNGTAPNWAEISTDWIDLSVRYRRAAP